MSEDSELIAIKVKRAFELTLDDGTKYFIPAGPQAVVPAVAKHWYTQEHLDNDVEPPKLGDFEFAELVRIRAEEARAIADDLAQQHASAVLAFEEARAASEAEAEAKRQAGPHRRVAKTA